MAFELYFAGTQNAQAMDLIRQLGCNKLLSQFNDRSAIREWGRYFEEHPDCKSKLFVDSGAWSAYTKGIDIDLDDYIDFINETGHFVTVFAEVDKIPGRYGQPVSEADAAEAPEVSWNNYIYMVEHVNPEYVDKIIPVFHYGEDFKYLKQILNYRFPDGHMIQYMGLGAIADLDRPQDRYNWFDECFKMIKASDNADIKVHAFGMTALSILKDFPIYSADSTTWIMSSCHGNIIVDGKNICLGSKKWYDTGNINQKSLAAREAVEKTVGKYGFTIEQLGEDYVARSMFNVYSLNEWAQNYKYVPHQDTYKVNLF